MSGWNPPPPPDPNPGPHDPHAPPGSSGPHGPPGPHGPHIPHGAPGAYGPPAFPGGPGMPGGPMPPPVPPRRERGKGLLIGLLAGGFALLLVLGVGGYAVYYTSTAHELTIPDRAGGMTLDESAEAARLYTELIPDMRRVVLGATDATDYDWRQGLYRDGDLAFLVVGFTGGYDGDNLVSALSNAVGRELSTDDARVTSRIWEIDDPGGDGTGLCGRLTASAERATAYAHTSICGWAGRTTFALVIPIVTEPEQQRDEPPEYEVTGLQRVMRDIRADVES
ncbi:hypothetical protein GCM10010182_76110 [Actinomadura cremea]|nr:hypothetical protein GCM10010182_76110 [Actinomadura cremea]